MHAAQGAALEVGVGHVVAVAHIGELEALKLLAVFRDGEEVGQDLAGMVGIGQRVDDRHIGAGSDLFDLGLGKRAQHDAVVEVLKHLYGVLNRLAARESRVVVGHNAGVGAQTIGADLERVARAQRRLLHDDSDGLAGKRRLVDAGGPIGLLALGGLEDKQAKQVPAGKRLVHGSP